MMAFVSTSILQDNQAMTGAVPLSKMVLGSDGSPLLLPRGCMWQWTGHRSPAKAYLQNTGASGHSHAT